MKLPDMDESAPVVNWGREQQGAPGVYRMHNEPGKTLATHTATNTVLPFPNNMQFDTTQCYIEFAWDERQARRTHCKPLSPAEL